MQEKNPDNSEEKEPEKRKGPGFYIGIIFLIVIIAAILIALSNQGMFYNDPELSVADVNLGSVSLTKTEVDITFEIENPNFFGATVSGIDYNLSYNSGDGSWNNVGFGHADKFNLPANGVGIVHSKTEINNADAIFSVGKSIINRLLGEKPEPKLRINGTAYLNLLFFEIPVEFDEIYPLTGKEFLTAPNSIDLIPASGILPVSEVHTEYSE